MTRLHQVSLKITIENKIKNILVFIFYHFYGFSYFIIFMGFHILSFLLVFIFYHFYWFSYFIIFMGFLDFIIFYGFLYFIIFMGFHILSFLWVFIVYQVSQPSSSTGEKCVSASSAQSNCSGST